MKTNFFPWSAIAFFSLLFSACGDDSSSSSTKADDTSKVTVQDVIDSVTCNGGVSVDIKEVNDSTLAIMCGTDSVGYVHASEYDECDISIHQGSQGMDFVCGEDVIGSVNIKKENGKSENDKPSNEKPDEIKCDAEVILPDPLDFMYDFSKCVVEHEDSFGLDETWILHVSLNKEQISKLWNIQTFGFTPDEKHGNKNDVYVASGKKIAMSSKFTISFNLSNKGGLYEGDVVFKQGDLTCEEFVSANPEYECLDDRAVEIENIGVCSDGKYDKKYEFCAADGIRNLCGSAGSYNIEFYDCMDDELVLLYAFDETLDFLNQYIAEVIGFEEDGDEFTSERWIAVSNINEPSLESFRKILFAAGFGATSQPNLYIIPKEDNEFGYSIEILPEEESAFYRLDIRKIKATE